MTTCRHGLARCYQCWPQGGRDPHRPATNDQVRRSHERVVEAYERAIAAYERGER